MPQDISDLYLKDSTFPDYDPNRIENTNFQDVIVSKVEMILSTNQGECTDPNFGANIPKYLWQTKFSSSAIQQEIINQFIKYIPELSPSDYTINVYILPGQFQDIGVVQISLGIAQISVLYQ